MQIGIIGAGHVGGALGTRWAQAGHQVIFGSRNPHRMICGNWLPRPAQPHVPHL